MKKTLLVLLAIITVMTALMFSTISASAATTELDGNSAIEYDSYDSYGTTGECFWYLIGTKLTIRGNGSMGSYNNYSILSPWGTGITEVIIENGVTSIGSYAFYRCIALKNISLPSSVKSIGSNAFYFCESLSGIVIPAGVTSIGSEAFYKCSKINEVILPDSLISIGKGAFSLCRFTSITIPQNVSSIGAGAFEYCSVLTSIEVNKNNSTYYSANNCIIKKSTNALVAGCNSSVIPDGVTSIEEDAFSGCSARVNIIIPDSVTRIGGWAFSGSDFTSITMPKSVTHIGYGAFYLCSDLTDVYYSGNKVDKGAIDIGGQNEKLTTAHWHYAPCENDSHIYNYDCTTICKNCDYIRTSNTEHTFDNDCDEVCNVCGTHRIAKHIFEQLGENTAKCKVCDTSKNFDFIINTDETITLSYEARKEFDFVIENTSIAKIINVSSSIVSSGTYYRKVSSAKISSVYPGETTFNAIDSDGSIMATSTLLVVEGEHQLQLSKILKEVTCTEPGKELHICKFCSYQEERTVPALRHTEVVDEAIAPTCTKDGLTEGKHCSVCNEIIIAQIVVDKTGEHLWNNGRVDKDGNVHCSCKTCDATRSKTLLSIAVTTLPNNITYMEGEHSISSEGMVITAYYDDGSSEVIKYNYSLQWGGPFTPPIQIVTVEYMRKITTFTVNILSDKNGWQYETGIWYYYEKGVKVKNGWRKDNTGWCFLDADGKWVINAFVKDGTGKLAYITKSGYYYETTGWIQFHGDWYYLEKGYAVTNDWRKDSVGWCYLSSTGAMVTNNFVKDSVGLAYITKDGYFYATENGWRLVNNEWYFVEKGYAVRNTWRADSIGWCYLSSTGAMVTNNFVKDSVGYAYITANGYFYATENGWKYVNNEWYFVEKGYAVRNRWRKDSQGWCFLSSTGAMVTNDWVKDNTGWCYLDESGYWDGIYYDLPVA